ncbi:peptidyl-prolyl cis-trans isomerase [Paenibacillus sp. GCM10023252]|uniref:peptidylprolyl isomerase n=1 Tax=Paenibacillus sp. GCM10023252 TaxID=3252649 RepID=UPI0036215C9A
MQVGATKRHRGLLSILILVITIVSLLIASCSDSSSTKPASIVAWVDGIPIEEGEMLKAMNQNRSLVFNYFHEKHGAVDSSEFWTKSYDGEVPMERLKKLALDTLVRMKVERGLAYEEKLVTTLDYKSFLTEWKLENKRRKDMVAKGGVIYGPVEFSEDQYLQYSHSKLMIELKEAWAKSQQVSEEQLIAEYEKTKEERYRKSDQFEIEVVTIPYNEDNRESLLLTMQSIQKAWKSGNGSLEELSKLNQAYYEQHTYTRGEDSVEASYPGIWEAIHQLKTGESSEIISERSAWVWFHVKDRQAGGYEEFEKLKDAVKNQYIEEQFIEMIEEKIRLADMKINEDSYKALSV